MTLALPAARRHIVRALAVFAWCAFAASASAQPSSTALTFEAAAAHALEHNPQVTAARLKQAIAAQEIAVARERPNPEVRVELEKEAPKESYGFALPLEIGGKRSNRIQVAQASARTGDAEIAQVVVETRAAVRRAFYGRMIADARLALIDELRGLAQRARDAAQQRFDAGDVPRLELVQAELVLGQAESERLAAQATSDASRVQLNALLGLPLDSPTPLAASLDEGAIPPVALAAEQAIKANAEIAVLDKRIEEQRARVSLARSLQTPDVVPEATLTRNAEPEFQTGWRAAVSLAVPLFTTHRAGVLVEQTTLTQLDAERQAVQARVAGDATAAAQTAAAQRQRLQQYQDSVLPRAIEVERMAEDAYRLGQTGIVALLQALQATRDARLRSLDAAEEFQNTMAELERLMGVTIR